MNIFSNNATTVIAVKEQVPQQLHQTVIQESPEEKAIRSARLFISSKEVRAQLNEAISLGFPFKPSTLESFYLETIPDISPIIEVLEIYPPKIHLTDFDGNLWLEIKSPSNYHEKINALASCIYFKNRYKISVRKAENYPDIYIVYLEDRKLDIKEKLFSKKCLFKPNTLDFGLFISESYKEGCSLLNKRNKNWNKYSFRDDLII